jgi:hypothetical protein
MDAGRARNPAIEALDHWYAGERSPQPLVLALHAIIWELRLGGGECE